jgi:hypothetical protein
MMLLDEPSFIGFFPYGKARAGRSPGVNDFSVCPRVRADPFEQVEDERLYGVRHGNLPSGNLRTYYSELITSFGLKSRIT